MSKRDEDVSRRHRSRSSFNELILLGLVSELDPDISRVAVVVSPFFEPGKELQKLLLIQIEVEPLDHHLVPAWAFSVFVFPPEVLIITEHLARANPPLEDPV